MLSSARVLLVGAVVFLHAVGVTSADGLGGAAVETQGLNPHAMGGHPMAQPRYDGVDQLLVLSDRWVILVFNDMHRLKDEINRLSGGELQKHIDDWDAGQQAGKPHWGAYKGKPSVRDRYMVEARENIGERAYSRATTYRISSDGDAAYAEAQPASRATRLLVSQGRSRTTDGVFPIEFTQYCFVELPEPMQPGATYTVAHADGRSVTFGFDLMATVSRAIKVNQLGYLPDGPPKIAYLGAHLYDFGPLDLSHAESFRVVRAADGRVVHEGEVALRAKNPEWVGHEGKRPPMYGEDIYELDFSAVNEPGWYFLSVPGVGRSWPFRIGPGVYGELFFTSMRGLYHQRCTVELHQPYTAWHREMCHDWPIYENDMIVLPIHEVEIPEGYQRFDIIGATEDRSRSTPPVAGGWHDAADWDRGTVHLVAVFDMLSAFEHRPHAFADGQLNIPESGNGIPDLLDEAAYGLRVWTASMDERGAVSGMVETSTHPKIDDERYPYSFARRTRWDSLIYAAAAAQLARAIKPFDAEAARRYLGLANKAYDFGKDPANSLGTYTMDARTRRGEGDPYTVTFTEKPEHIWPYLLHAKAQLYLTTKDMRYWDGLGDWAYDAHPPMRWRFSVNDFSPWIYASVVQCAEALPDDLVAKWRRNLLQTADERVQQTHDMPYRIAWPTDKPIHMAWGASHGQNLNRVLWIAYLMTGESRYREAAIYNIDGMLGANAHGMSWTTGIGYTYPTDIQHEPSEDDGIADPVPGITVYGITGGPVYYQFRRDVWESPSPDNPEQKIDFTTPAQRNVPLWRRFMMHPSLNVPMNEFTVASTQAGMALSAAMLMPDETWAPPQRLKQHQPRRPELLFGHYYLP